jgi:hypothetical protein
MKKSRESGNNGYAQLSDLEKMLIKMAEALLERLTGKKVHFKIIGLPGQGANEQAPVANEQAPGTGGQKAGWGLEYHQDETYSEKEAMTFKASGLVKTTDGKEIRFEVDLSMSREFMATHSIDVRGGDAKMVDPLVINFDGSTPGVTDGKYSFDLDSDGNKDKISFAAPGSGFLALDKNIGALYLGNIPAQFSFTDQGNTPQAEVQNAGIYLKEDGSAGTLQQINLAV